MSSDNIDPYLKALEENHNRDWPDVMKLHLSLVKKALIVYAANQTDQNREDLKLAINCALDVENIDKSIKGLKYLPSRTKSFLTT